MIENWRDIPGFEGRYQVSDLGQVRSSRGVLKPQKHSAGYRHVKLSGKTQIIGPLVLAAFIGPRPEGHEHAHWDRDKENNRLSNLRWATPKQNCADRTRHGVSYEGTLNPNAKLSRIEVIIIKYSAGRGKDLAERFGVSTTQVNRIRRGERW